jgi:hypothetical protein
VCPNFFYYVYYVDFQAITGWFKRKGQYLEGVIVRNELYEHKSNFEGYQDNNIYELMNECVCVYVYIQTHTQTYTHNKCIYIYTHTHTHTHICILFFCFKIMRFNAQGWSTWPKYVPYIDEIYKTSLWLTAVCMLVLIWYYQNGINSTELLPRYNCLNLQIQKQYKW